MNKKLSLILLLALPVMLLSCKKCYDCKNYEYCLQCTGVVSGVSVDYDECYDTEAERTTAEQSIIQSFQQSGGTATCGQGTSKYVPGLDQEVCGSKKEVDDDVAGWETLGYQCAEQ